MIPSRKERILQKRKRTRKRLKLLSISFSPLLLLYSISHYPSDSYSYFTSTVTITGIIMTEENFDCARPEDSFEEFLDYPSDPQEDSFEEEDTSNQGLDIYDHDEQGSGVDDPAKLEQADVVDESTEEEMNVEVQEEAQPETPEESEEAIQHLSTADIQAVVVFSAMSFSTQSVQESPVEMDESVTETLPENNSDVDGAQEVSTEVDAEPLPTENTEIEDESPDVNEDPINVEESNTLEEETPTVQEPDKQIIDEPSNEYTNDLDDFMEISCPDNSSIDEDYYYDNSVEDGLDESSLSMDDEDLESKSSEEGNEDVLIREEDESDVTTDNNNSSDETDSDNNDYNEDVLLEIVNLEE